VEPRRSSWETATSSPASRQAPASGSATSSAARPEAHLLSGLALAGEQFRITGDGSTITDVDTDHDGEVIHHGAFVGLGLEF